MKRKKIQPETEEIKGPKMVVGLDIGTTKMVMVMGYLCDDGKVEVCGFGKGPSTGVQHGLVINIKDTIEGILIAKGQVEEVTGQQVSEVYVGIAGRHIKSVSCTNTTTRINGHDEIITEQEIAGMNDAMQSYVVDGGRVIAVIPQNYRIDGIDTHRPAGMVGQNLTTTYQLITGNDFEIRKIIRCVTDSNLVMQKLLLEPLASSLSCLTEEEKKNGVALIDIGGGTTDLIIYDSGVPVYVRVIPVGGQVITKDIQALGMTYEEAEHIKIDHGSCMPEHADRNHFISLKNSVYFGDNVQINECDLAKVINARVNRDILEPVNAELEKSGYKSKIIRVVITGGGSRLKDIKSLAEFVFQKKTRIGVPGFGCTQTLESTLKDPTYSTALGLLIYGCRAEAQPYSVVRTQTAGEKHEVEDVEESPSTDGEGRSNLVNIISRGIDRIWGSLVDTSSDEGVD